jgi:glyoxylase-like metal-dependent hydrolase (beta-lactamase superfamily II)
VAAGDRTASEGGVAVLDGNLHHLVVLEDDIHPITLYVSAATGFISKLTTRENDPVFSDVDVEAFFYGWQPVTGGDLLAPSQVYLAVNEVVLHIETRTAVEMNPAFPSDNFALPDGASPTYEAELAERGRRQAQHHQHFSGFGIPQDGYLSYVEATETGPGVFFLTGGSHNSMAVEQASGVVIFDAPNNPERGEAILDWVETQFPGKPVTHVVVSHFHGDHTAGLRAFVAAGATVVVGEGSAAHYREIFSRPRTILPDTLEASPTAAHIVEVPAGGAVTLADATNPVDVHSVYSWHAYDFLVPYLPDDEAVFIVDVYSPGLGVNALSAQVFQEIDTTLGLTVSNVYGGHGGTTTWALFESELATAGLLP